MTEAKFFKGQMVWVHTRRNGWMPENVVSAGPKWFTVTKTTGQFSQETGLPRAKQRGVGAGSSLKVISDTDHRDMAERFDMEQAIRQAGVRAERYNGTGLVNLPIGMLRKVHAAVMGEQHTEYRLVRVQDSKELVYARGSESYVEDMFQLHAPHTMAESFRQRFGKQPVSWEVRLVEITEHTVSTVVKTDAEVAAAKEAAAAKGRP